jgi:hypothetical protein
VMARALWTTTVGERVTVTQTCQWCYRDSSVTVDRDAFDRWQKGELVQTAFAELSADDRETLVSGTHAACWDAMWGGDDAD